VPAPDPTAPPPVADTSTRPRPGLRPRPIQPPTFDTSRRVRPITPTPLDSARRPTTLPQP
jgi:hypothetical protein